jgi:hypothetical protein
MPKEGAANSANSTVTTRVINALFQPETLNPIIKTKSRIMGMTEIIAAIGLVVLY